MENTINKEPQRAFLYEGLPCIPENGKYILFSPYRLKLAIMKKEDFSNPELRNYLEKVEFFGKPFEPGKKNDISKITLILTNNCNLQCVYCYMSGGEGQILEMTIDKAQEAIELCVSNGKTDQLRISFFGGEPTLAFSKIQKVVNFAKKLGVNLAFHISTNGMINNNIINYLIEEKFLIGVSMDGLPEINDSLRPSFAGKSPSRIIESAIQKLAKGEAKFLVRATVLSSNVNNMVESLEYWANLGAKYIHFEPLNVSGRAQKKQLKPADPDEYINNFKKALDRAEELGVYVISSPFLNLLTPSTYYCSSTSGESFLLTPDNAISKCYEVQNLDHNHNLFLVGKYDNSLKGFTIDNKKCQYLSELSVENYEECKNCYAKYLCGGGCHLRNLNATGSLFKIDPYSCKIRKELIKEAILRIKKSIQLNKPSPVLGINSYENFLSWTVNGKKNKIDTKKKSYNTIRYLKEQLILQSFPLPNEVETVLEKDGKVIRIKDRCESVF